MGQEVFLTVLRLCFMLLKLIDHHGINPRSDIKYEEATKKLNNLARGSTFSRILTVGDHSAKLGSPLQYA